MNFHNHALILAMIESLRMQNSRTGKTAIIKGMFLAKATGSNVPFEFFLYKHGPYSTEVENVLEEMRSYNAVDVEPAFDGYGVTLSPDENATFVKSHAPLSREEQCAIDRVCRFIRYKNVNQLERLATAAWIRTEEGINDSEDVIKRLRELKPHVSLSGAREADQQVAEFLQQA